MLAADVQPIYIHHFDQWPNQPFDPKIEDGEFMGRGVDDNKGNLLTALQVSALLVPKQLKLMLPCWIAQCVRGLGRTHVCPRMLCAGS